MENTNWVRPYVGLDGGEVPLDKLDHDEREFIKVLQCRAQTDDWNEFDSFWMKAVAEFYDSRGLSRRQSSKTEVFRIAQDLSSRLAVASGVAPLARLPRGTGRFDPDSISHAVRFLSCYRNF